MILAPQARIGMKFICKPAVASVELVVDPAGLEQLHPACHQDAVLAALAELMAQKSLASDLHQASFQEQAAVDNQNQADK